MQFLVEMRLADSGRPATPQAGLELMEQYVLPTLEACSRLLAEGRIRAGGPISGTIGIAMIVEAGSARELDDLVESLPIWPRTRTEITPLTTFDGRAESLVAVRERVLKTRERAPAA